MRQTFLFSFSLFKQLIASVVMVLQVGQVIKLVNERL